MPNANTVNPSLDGARARIARASEHIERLKAETAALADKDWTTTIGPGNTGTVIHDLAEIPPIIAILIGETVYNLRAALDYLIHELAILDSRKPQLRTQFPLESSKDSWNNHEKTWLRGIGDVHKARIKQLQPFSGVTWTTTLRDISNPDKHRHLTVGSHGPAVHVSANWARSAQKVSAAIDQPLDMHVESKGHVILFDDGGRAVETLEMLKQQVSDVIDVFEPEFSGLSS